jgi:spoIIIJ-associated protein
MGGQEMEKEFEAKSVEESLELACKELNVRSEEINFSVVQEPSRGFLGIGSKSAIVKVSINDNYNVRIIKEFLEKMLKFYGQEGEVIVDVLKTMSFYSVKVKSTSALSNLIGKHGKTMESVEHLLSVYVNKMNDHKISILLDVNDYRIRREAFIRKMVNDAITKIRKQNVRRISLEPMDNRERKIVHEILSQNSDLKAYSVGDEPYRHIVIENLKVRI